MIVEQGTPEWEAARLGKLTASRFYDATGRTKTGNWLATRRHYMLQLVAERLTGMRGDAYQFLSSPMQWGIETEPQARMAYQRARGVEIAPSGFVDHAIIPMTGGSPDGFVGEDGLLEIKCPDTATHVATLIEREIPEKYMAQMLWQLACTKRQWCDYVSYDPRMPPKFRAAVIRVERDRARIALMEDQALEFLEELAGIIGGLNGGYLYVPEWRRVTPIAIAAPKPAAHVPSEDMPDDAYSPPAIKPRKRKDATPP